MEMQPDAAPTETRGREQFAPVGKLMISYEEFGNPSDETVLLVMGLGMQMIAWDEEFCRLLVERGFHVIRFDNRDVGLSSKLSGRVNIPAGMVGLTGSAVYTLDEMAADAAGLLDHVGIEAAHVVGASMGGMIGQKLAATRASRVRSLVSIMSNTGKRRVSALPRPDAMRALLRRPPSSREEFVDDMIETFETIGSPAYPADPVLLRERVAASYDRCFYPAGVARQLMAVLASGDRTRELGRITAPTQVVHGTADRLVPPRAGRDTAAAIPGARLELIDGMGHDLPRQLWPQFVEMIERTAANAAGTAAP
jgi:pimeloyl-ACP methyl ester carboxylesterase